MATHPMNFCQGSYSWKPAFQALLRPAVRRLARRGVTANGITLLGFGVSATAAGMLMAFPRQTWIFGLLPPVLLVRMALNAMDGMLAREHGQASALGACLNELGDVASDAMLLAPFALVPGVSGWWIAAVTVLIALSEMAGLMGLANGSQRRYEGPLGKSDRALLLGVLGLWIGMAGELPEWIASGFPLAMAGGLIVTIFFRVKGSL